MSKSRRIDRDMHNSSNNHLYFYCFSSSFDHSPHFSIDGDNNRWNGDDRDDERRYGTYFPFSIV